MTRETYMRTVLQMITDKKRSSLRNRAGDQPSVRSLADVVLDKERSFPRYEADVIGLLADVVFDLGFSAAAQLVSPGGGAVDRASERALEVARKMSLLDEDELSDLIVSAIEHMRQASMTTYEIEKNTITIDTKALTMGEEEST